MEEQVKVRQQIKLSDIVNDLDNGLTRYKSQDFGHGSIEEKYNLTVGEVRELFMEPKLYKRKTKRLGKGLSFDIIDDIEDEIVLVKGEDIINMTVENVNKAIEELENKDEITY